MDEMKYSSEDIANAMVKSMVMANFSGCIAQVEGRPLLQFKPGPFSRCGRDIGFGLEFGGCRFKVTVSPSD